jgi:hypothetical protein
VAKLNQTVLHGHGVRPAAVGDTFPTLELLTNAGKTISKLVVLGLARILLKTVESGDQLCGSVSVCPAP